MLLLSPAAGSFWAPENLEKAKHLSPKGECSGAIRRKPSCLFLQKWEHILATLDTVLHVAADTLGIRAPSSTIISSEAQMLLVPIFVRNGSKTGFSFCAFPLLLPWLLQRLSKWNSWTHMALSASVGNQSPVKLGHCAHMGKGCALRIATFFFTVTPKFISISHTFTLLPVTLISQELKKVTRRSHKTLLLPDVQMHAGLIRKINRELKPSRYKVAQQLFQPTRKR